MSQAAVSINLPNDLGICHQMIEHLMADMEDRDREILNLKGQLEVLRRRIFGRKSEKIDPNQMALFEDLTRRLAEAEKAASDEATDTPNDKDKGKGKGRRNGGGRRPLPPDLPRNEIVHEPDEHDRTCPCCHQSMTRIGEEVTEKLDYVPASFVVHRHIRPKYACQRCAEGVVIAPLPPQPIPKGIPAEGLLAQVLTSKYADHNPLNRQSGIFHRHEVDIAVSTMCDWVRDMADLLSPIVIAMTQQILHAHRINTDDTPVLVQNLAGKPCGKGYLWVYIGDGAQAVFDFTETHSRDGPLRILRHYAGYVQADAHSSYNALFAPSPDGTPSPRVEVGCWAHARRKFYEARLDDRRRCSEMLALIGRLFEVEREATHAQLAPEDRLALRHEQSAPVLGQIQDRLEPWSIELLPKNPVAQAVQYARGQWTALNRFLEDGRLPLDNNISERMLRLAAVGRKNYMFFGSDAGGHRAAVIYSLVASCKLINLDPFAYLRNVIAITCDPAFDRFAEITPAAWKASHPA